jgi:hypothetical protein
MSENGHYEAETCLTGGYLCGHRHTSEAGAARCLPSVPRSPSGSLTNAFSLAGVRWVGAGRDPRDTERDSEADAAEREADAAEARGCVCPSGGSDPECRGWPHES